MTSRVGAAAAGSVTPALVFGFAATSRTGFTGVTVEALTAFAGATFFTGVTELLSTLAGTAFLTGTVFLADWVELFFKAPTFTLVVVSFLGLRGALFATFTGLFLATAFFAGTFFTGAFFAGAFFAGAFFAGTFFAGAFLTGNCLTAAFFEGAADFPDAFLALATDSHHPLEDIRVDVHKHLGASRRADLA